MSKFPEPKKMNLWRKCANWISRSWQKLYPSPPVRRGASISLFVIVLIMAVLYGMSMRLGLPWLFNPVVGVLFCMILAALVGLGLFLLLKILSILPRFLTPFGVVVFGVFLYIMTSFPLPNAFLIALIIGIGEALLGGVLVRLFKRRLSQETWYKRIFIIAVLLVTIAMNIYFVYWFVYRGDDEHLVEWRAKAVQVEPLDMPDPSLLGPYAVKHLTYGSGTDKRRHEFGKDAALTTESVDAEAFVKGSKGWRMKLRKWFWGFGFEKFPRNGRVWYPEGDGPFPLILCVHGNHNMAEFSDPGYAYLGQHLASRGFIFVSVDENFFNGHLFGSLKTENDGRGWMLLQHLKVWRVWNKTEGNPFYAKVDMANIGLIGHSRGGEAAAIAGSFNRLSHYPDDATIEFDFDFAIKAIVAIAPSDGQYQPAGRPTPLENVNYLTLQGAHDADVSSFAGARQYNRVKFTDGNYWFKSYIYSYRSNHGQFNTIWGDSDFGKPWGMTLNRKALLDGEEQRKIGTVYMTAFFEIALKGTRGYIPLFRDFRRIQEWLPDDIYINRFEDTTFQVVSDFDEDVDVTTTTLEGGSIKGENLAVWREENLGFRRGGRKENNVVVVGWLHPEPEDSESESSQIFYAIELPEGAVSGFGLTSESVLVFSLAQADEKPPNPEDEDDEEKKKDKEKDKKKEPLELSVELVTRDGQTARFPLSHFRTVPPILKAKYTKFKNESERYGKAYEPTLQLFELPLSNIEKSFPAFSPAQLKTIRFVFDRSPKGVIILDRLGFAKR